MVRGVHHRVVRISVVDGRIGALVSGMETGGDS